MFVDVFFVILDDLFKGMGMLRLENHCLEMLYAEARKHYPAECCGLLGGIRDDQVWHVQAVLPLRNVVSAGVHESYQIDPQERHEKEAALRAKGLELMGFYHSHPDHGVYFSQRDLEHSEEYQFGEPWLKPVYAYVVVSVQGGVVKDYGAFIVEEGLSKSIQSEILEQRSHLHVS